MKIEIESKYELGDVLYRIENNKLESIIIVGIRAEKTEWCIEYTDNENEYSVSYLIGHPETPEKEIEWEEEPDMADHYFKSIDEALNYLKDNIQ